MAWSPRFATDLKHGTIAPNFIVRGIKTAESPGPGWQVGGPVAAFGSGIVQGVTVSGSRVSTSDWSATTGGISVRLIGDLSGLLPRIHRGQVVEVLAGFPGYSEADYQQIALGQVYDLTRQSDAREYTLTLRDIWAALSSRISTSADELSLFAGLSSTATTVKVNWTGGGTIDITRSTEFPKETGGNGAFSVVDNSGATFYVTWSSSVALTPGRRYTIVSANALNTTSANADAGNAVQAIGYIDDEPPDVVRKIIASTGAGTNGAYDTLPADWGMGLPDRFIAHDDIKRTLRYTRTVSGSNDWEVWSSTSQANPAAWLFGILKPAGYFPAIVQGQMTVRAAVNPVETSAYLLEPTPRNDVPHLNDSMLTRQPLSSWSAWSPDHGVEYYRVTVQTTGSTVSSEEVVGAMPAEDTYTVEIGDYIPANKGNWMDSTRDRLRVWLQRVPERFSVNLVDMAMAGHAIGSVPFVTSAVLHGRIAKTSDGLHSVPALVTQMAIEWQQRTMTLTFEIVSDSASDF